MEPSLKSTVEKIPLLTVNAGPRDKQWIDRLKEELLALIKYVEINKAEDNDWFKIESNADGTKWHGKCWYIHEHVKYEFDLQFEIPATYPLTPIELELPELDGKTVKMYRGGKICLDVHFAPLWSKNSPKFGIAHALALALGPWLAAEVPILIGEGKIEKKHQSPARKMTSNNVDLKRTLISEFKNLEEIWTIQKEIITKYKQMKIAFIQFDNNNDGWILMDEFIRLMVSKNIETDTAKIERFFKFMDTNHDGKINENDWNIGFQKINHELLEIRSKMQELNSKSDKSSRIDTESGQKGAANLKPIDLNMFPDSSVRKNLNPYLRNADSSSPEQMISPMKENTRKKKIVFSNSRALLKANNSEGKDKIEDSSILASSEFSNFVGQSDFKGNENITKIIFDSEKKDDYARGNQTNLIRQTEGVGTNQEPQRINRLYEYLQKLEENNAKYEEIQDPEYEEIAERIVSGRANTGSFARSSQSNMTFMDPNPQKTYSPGSSLKDIQNFGYSPNKIGSAAQNKLQKYKNHILVHDSGQPSLNVSHENPLSLIKSPQQHNNLSPTQFYISPVIDRYRFEPTLDQRLSPKQYENKKISFPITPERDSVRELKKTQMRDSPSPQPLPVPKSDSVNISLVAEKQSDSKFSENKHQVAASNPFEGASLTRNSNSKNESRGRLSAQEESKHSASFRKEEFYSESPDIKQRDSRKMDRSREDHENYEEPCKDNMEWNLPQEILKSEKDNLSEGEPQDQIQCPESQREGRGSSKFQESPRILVGSSEKTANNDQPSRGSFIGDINRRSGVIIIQEGASEEEVERNLEMIRHPGGMEYVNDDEVIEDQYGDNYRNYRDNDRLIDGHKATLPGTDIPLDEFEIYYEDEDEEGQARYEERRREMFKETMPQIPENEEENEISYISARGSAPLKAKKENSASSQNSDQKSEGEPAQKSPTKLSGSPKMGPVTDFRFPVRERSSSAGSGSPNKKIPLLERVESEKTDFGSPKANTALRVGSDSHFSEPDKEHEDLHHEETKEERYELDKQPEKEEAANPQQSYPLSSGRNSAGSGERISIKKLSTNIISPNKKVLDSESRNKSNEKSGASMSPSTFIREPESSSKFINNERTSVNVKSERSTVSQKQSNSPSGQPDEKEPEASQVELQRNQSQNSTQNEHYSHYFNPIESRKYIEPTRNSNEELVPDHSPSLRGLPDESRGTAQNLLMESSQKISSHQAQHEHQEESDYNRFYQSQTSDNQRGSLKEASIHRSPKKESPSERTEINIKRSTEKKKSPDSKQANELSYQEIQAQLRCSLDRNKSEVIEEPSSELSSVQKRDQPNQGSLSKNERKESKTLNFRSNKPAELVIEDSPETQNTETLTTARFTELDKIISNIDFRLKTSFHESTDSKSNQHSVMTEQITPKNLSGLNNRFNTESNSRKPPVTSSPKREKPDLLSYISLRKDQKGLKLNERSNRTRNLSDILRILESTPEREMKNTSIDNIQVERTKRTAGEDTDILNDTLKTNEHEKSSFIQHPSDDRSFHISELNEKFEQKWKKNKEFTIKLQPEEPVEKTYSFGGSLLNIEEQRNRLEAVKNALSPESIRRENISRHQNLSISGFKDISSPIYDPANLLSKTHSRMSSYSQRFENTGFPASEYSIDQGSLSRRNRRSNKYYEILNSLNTFSIKTEPEEERDNFENMHLRNLSANHDMLREMSGFQRTYLLSELTRLDVVNRELEKVNTTLRYLGNK